MYPAKDIQLHVHGSIDPVYESHRRSLDMVRLEHASRTIARAQKLDEPPQADLALLTLNSDFNKISSVRYQTLCMNAPKPVENVENFHHIPDCSKKIQPDKYYFGCTRAGLKTQKSLEKVLKFLRGNISGDRAEITVGGSAIVERLEIEGREGGKITHEGGQIMVNFTQFCKTKCKPHSPNLNPLLGVVSPELESNQSQYLNLRSSNLKAKDKIEAFSSIHILSGMCLFSQEHLGYLHGESVSPQKIPAATERYFSDHLIPLPVDRRPTLYEIESLVRLPNAIADIVSTLPTAIDVIITLDVPRVQYYAFLLDLYAVGRCSKERLASWIEIIDTRHYQIAAVFEKAIGDALQRRGVDRENVRIRLSTGLEEVIPHIQKTINQGGAPSVDSLLRELQRLDPLFRDFYGHLLASQNPPQNIVNLCYSSYTYQVLRPVIQSVYKNQPLQPDAQKRGTLDRKLLIVIDNPAEWRVYAQAEKILKQYQDKYSSIISPLILGIFPSELIFTAENTNRASLYLRNAGQYIYDESGERIVGPSDIVERVYGTGVTQRIVALMRKEGMFNMSSMLAVSNAGFSSSKGSSSGGDGTSSPATSWNSEEGSPRVSVQRLERVEVEKFLEDLSLNL